VRVAKTKEFGFDSVEDFRVCASKLLESGRCRLTSVELDLGRVDADRAPSLDRIDPDGHYEPGNLKVVAWFANRWKNDDSDENFARLLRLVRAA